MLLDVELFTAGPAPFAAEAAGIGAPAARRSKCVADARAAAEWLERAAASDDATVVEFARAELAELRARDPP